MTPPKEKGYGVGKNRFTTTVDGDTREYYVHVPIKNTTQWNIYPGAFNYCAGEVSRDDIKFLKQIISELKFNVDAKRMYLVRFSNGGQMAFRAAAEMSDAFAAVVEASGSVSRDTTAVPRRDLPVTFQIGNSDDIALGSSSETVPIHAPLTERRPCVFCCFCHSNSAKQNGSPPDYGLNRGRAGPFAERKNVFMTFRHPADGRPPKGVPRPRDETSMYPA